MRDSLLTGWAWVTVFVKRLIDNPKTSALGMATLFSTTHQAFADPGVLTEGWFWTQVFLGMAAISASDHKTSDTGTETTVIVSRTEPSPEAKAL